tara:strand:+ start:1196 stop:2047 length:852 start_codon:yes stop_codon:yes gene_type:complete
MTNLIVKPLSSALGAEIIGGNYSQPLNDEDISLIYSSFLKYHLLCLRSNKLNSRELYRLANYFGLPFTEITRNHWDQTVPEISILDSTYKSLEEKPQDPRLNRRNGWHTDHSFKKYPPKATILHGIEIPSFAGHTRFCNTQKAYDDLPPAKKEQLSQYKAVHCYDTIRAQASAVKRTAEEIKDTPDVIHPLIRKHTETGKKAIYFNANRTDSIVGLSRKISDKILDDIDKHITQDKYRYDHKWETGDIIIWDNRCLIHSVNVDYPIGEPRIHLRTLIKDNNLK